MVDLDLNKPADEVYYDTEPQFCTQLPVVEEVDESHLLVEGTKVWMTMVGEGCHNTMLPLNRLILAYQILLLSTQHLLQTLVCRKGVVRDVGDISTRGISSMDKSG